MKTDTLKGGHAIFLVLAAVFVLVTAVAGKTLMANSIKPGLFVIPLVVAYFVYRRPGRDSLKDALIAGLVVAVAELLAWNMGLFSPIVATASRVGGTVQFISRMILLAALVGGGFYLFTQRSGR